MARNEMGGSGGFPFLRIMMSLTWVRDRNERAVTEHAARRLRATVTRH
jgi:hypothetical protein